MINFRKSFWGEVGWAKFQIIPCYLRLRGAGAGRPPETGLILSTFSCLYKCTFHLFNHCMLKNSTLSTFEAYPLNYEDVRN